MIKSSLSPLTRWLAVCGDGEGWNKVDPDITDVRLCVFLGSGVLAILLVAVFLEPVKDKLENEGETRSRPLWSTLLSTFMLFRDKRLCLLMFLPVYSGFQQGFLSGEYTKVEKPRARAMNLGFT